MRIQNIPQEDRPRERLERLGPQALNSAELLAVLFGSGGQGKSSLELGYELLDLYKGVPNLARAPAKELAALKGLGPAKVATLLAALELGRRAAGGPVEGSELRGRLMFWRDQLAREEREFIAAVYLDGGDRVIDDGLLSYGGLGGASLDAPYLLRRALRLDCASLALIHNHPDGSIQPSQDDRSLSDMIVRRLNLLGLRFYGHFIVAGIRMVRISNDGGFGTLGTSAAPL